MGFYSRTIFDEDGASYNIITDADTFGEAFDDEMDHIVKYRKSRPITQIFIEFEED